MKIIIGFILTTGIVLTVLLLLLLIKPNKRELHKTILIVFYVFILLVNLHSFANLHGLETLYKFTFLFDFTIIWLFAPLLFVYIKSIFEPSKELLKRNLLHFLPCILFVVGIGLPLSLKYFTSENDVGCHLQLSLLEPYYHSKSVEQSIRNLAEKTQISQKL